VSASVSTVVGWEVVSLEQRGVHIGMNAIQMDDPEKQDVHIGIEKEDPEKQDLPIRMNGIGKEEPEKQGVDFGMIGIEKQDQPPLIEMMEVTMDEESPAIAGGDHDHEAEND